MIDEEAPMIQMKSSTYILNFYSAPLTAHRSLPAQYGSAGHTNCLRLLKAKSSSRA